MIRRILLGLSGKTTPNLAVKSLTETTGSHGLISTPWINRIKSGFSSLARPTASQCLINHVKAMFLEPPQFPLQQVRTVIKYSLQKGKRKSVAAVTDRFFRLHWGIWIRTRAGRHKKLWKKSEAQRNRLSQHVFCNATQSRMLDKMVNKFWRKPKYYIEDPYEPYHKRENFAITSRKPWRPEGVDYE